MEKVGPQAKILATEPRQYSGRIEARFGLRDFQ